MAEKKDNSGSQRERVETPSGSRYVERDKEGKFKDVDDTGRSQAQDRSRTSEKESERGKGNRGDRD